MLKIDMLISSSSLSNIIIINWARKNWHSNKESDTEEANKQKSVEDMLFPVYPENWRCGVDSYWNAEED